MVPLAVVELGLPVGQDTGCVCACHPRHPAHGESSTGWSSLQRPPSTPQLSSDWLTPRRCTCPKWPDRRPGLKGRWCCVGT